MPDQPKIYMGRIVLDKALDLFDGIVGRVVVDDDAFEIRIGLKAYGLKTIADVLSVIVIGNNDGYFRRSRVDLA